MKKIVLVSLSLVLGASCEAALVRLVPEEGVSKKFTLKTDSEVEYVVSFYRPDVFRVEAAPKVWSGDETNRTSTVDFTDKKRDPARPVTILAPGYAEDKTGVKFADKDGKFTFTTSAIQVDFDKATEKMSVSDFRGKSVFSEAEPLKFTEDACTQTLASSGNVRYYGGGQQVGSVMHKGQKLLIDCDYNWAEGGCPNPAPFVLSSEGFGVMRHTFAPGSYDFTATNTCALTHSETRFDAFYFVSGGFPQVLDRYTEATGRPNMLPMWGLELGDADAYMTREKETKYPKQNEDGSFVETTPDVVRKVAMKYRDADMPVGWILVNDGYGCGHMQLGSVVDALKQLNIKTGLWTEGKLDRIAWEVGTAGTRVQKLDVAWTSQGGEYKAHHALQCNDDAFRGLTENADARAFVITVLGWAGTQRYGITWLGDEYGGWDLIRYSIPSLTGSSMSGFAYSMSDVDGIFGGSNETYTRDLQWKCWTLPMYVMNGWSHMNKCPWSYPEPYRSICRDALKRKIRLTPFFYSLMRESYETGAAIIRPMVWNYPDDPVTYDESTRYQFMVGEDVLVAPVYASEKITRGWWRKGIYLPAGDWYDYNDGRRVAGGQWLKAYPISIEKIPVFVRAGAILPMYPEALTTAGSDKSTLTFDIWPAAGTREKFEVYEDDGETLQYQKGAYSRQHVIAENIATSFDEQGDMTVVVTPAQGDFKGKPETRVYEYLIHTQAKPASVYVMETEGLPTRPLVDRAEVLPLVSEGAIEKLYANVNEGWYYDADEKGGTLHVKLAKRPTSATVALEVRMAEAVQARAESPAYPVPSAEEEEEAAAALVCKAVDMPLVHNTNVNKFADGDNLVVKVGERVIIDQLDGTYRRILGHVATHPDNKPEARFTFTIKAGNKTLFERANMKGSDVPQLIAVDVPGECDWVVFDFKADDESEASKSAKGVWKNVEFSAE